MTGQLMILRLESSPEHYADLLHALRAMAGPLRTHSGCVGCEISACIDSPRRLLLVEKWSDVGLLEEHLKSDDFQRVLALMELSTAPPELNFYAERSSRGLEYVAALRGIDWAEPDPEAGCPA